MEKEIAVTNTNSLMYIAKLNIFPLAKEMFKEIIITNEVLKEIFQKEAAEISLIKSELNKFLRKVEVKEMKDLPLDEGEKSAITFCLRNNIKTFLSDDKKARIIAESLGLKVIGVLGILLWSFKNKKLGREECKGLLNKLVDVGFYLSPNLYAEILRLIDMA